MTAGSTLFIQLAQDVIDGNKSYEDAEKTIALLLIQEQLDFDDLLPLRSNGMYQHATICLNLLKEVFIKSGNNTWAAKCDVEIASLYFSRGLFEEAIERFQFARKKFQDDNDSILDVLACDFNLAAAYTKIGRYEIAKKMYKSVNEQYNIIKSVPYLLQQLSNSNKDLNIEIAHCNFNMAEIELQESFFDTSLELYTKARIVYANESMPVDVAKCDVNIAMIYANTGKHDIALSKYRDAKALFEKANMAIASAKCDMHASISLLHIGRPNEALKYLNLARDVFDNKGITISVAHCDLQASTIYLACADENSSLTSLRSARSVYLKKGMTRDVAICDLNLAGISSNRKNYSAASELYIKILDNYGEDIDFKWKCLFGLGGIYIHQGNTVGAYGLYKEAIEQIETLRGSITNKDMRSSFLGEKRFVYRDMVECCLKLKNFEMAIEYVERLKSRNLAELIANKNLMPKNASKEEKHEYQRLRFQMKALAHRLNTEENHDRSVDIKEELEQVERKHEQRVLGFRNKDHQFDPDQRIIITYPEIKALIKDRESALIELFPMEDKTVAFVISENSEIEKSTVIISDYTIHTLYDHIDELSEKYQAYQAEIKNKAKRKDWEACLDAILKELYKKIFLNIQPHLDGIRKIIMIPYHAFHLIPLHAMFVEDNGHRRYVIDDYQVTFTPSAKILKYCRERRRNKNGKISVVHADPSDKKSPLFFAEGEVDYIGNLFDNAEKCFEVSKQEIKTIGLETHILHYAGHATSTALILHDEIDKEKSEIFSLEDIFTTLNLPEAYLATLSACETGVTKLGKTDEFIGLTSGLLHAGAASVICSLWTVDDISTSILMKKMYQNIKTGKGKAESLRDAQLWLKDPNNRQEHINMLPELRGKEHMIPADLAKPYYWAGFVCSGVE